MRLSTGCGLPSHPAGLLGGKSAWDFPQPSSVTLPQSRLQVTTTLRSHRAPDLEPCGLQARLMSCLQTQGPFTQDSIMQQAAAWLVLSIMSATAAMMAAVVLTMANMQAFLCSMVSANTSYLAPAFGPTACSAVASGSSNSMAA